MQPRHSIRSLIQRILPCLAAVASLLVVSCYPYQENPPPRKPKPGVTKPVVEKTEAEKLKAKELAAKEKKAADELKKTAAEKAANEDKLPPTPGGGAETPKVPEPPVVEKRAEYVTAKKIPGKEGFVLSPYNKKQIDVRDFKSGDLVRDPTYDKSEKKFFRVP